MNRPMDEFQEFCKFLQGREYEVCERKSSESVPPERLFAEWLEFQYAPSYDPSYGDARLCACGHTYHRHFDTYEDMLPVGCKYCYDCPGFSPAPEDAPCPSKTTT